MYRPGPPSHVAKRAAMLAWLVEHGGAEPRFCVVLAQLAHELGITREGMRIRVRVALKDHGGEVAACNCDAFPLGHTRILLPPHLAGTGEAKFPARPTGARRSPAVPQRPPRKQTPSPSNWLGNRERAREAGRRGGHHAGVFKSRCQFALQTLRKYRTNECRAEDLAAFSEGQYTAAELEVALQWLHNRGFVVSYPDGQETWWAAQAGNWMRTSHRKVRS